MVERLRGEFCRPWEQVQVWDLEFSDFAFPVRITKVMNKLHQ